MAAGLLLGIAGRLLAEIPFFVELHRAAIFPRIASLLQALSRGVAWPIGEAMWAIAALSGLTALLRLGSRAVAPLALAAGLAVAGFYASWGVAYHYPTLGSRLTPPPAEADEAAHAERLRDLARRSAALVRRAVADLPANDIRGDKSLLAMSDAIDRGIAKLPPDIEASPVRGITFGPAKRSFISPVLSRLLISGYFSPWTGEAQIDGQMPRTLWPRVGAHEKAHQRGFARENEATAIGLLACLASGEPEVFYSGALGVFVAFDNDLSRADPEARKAIWQLLPKRAIADLEGEAAFWKAHQGAVSKVSEAVNDTYLKAQGVHSGVRSYGEAARLLVQALETPSLPLRRLLDDATLGTLE